MENQTKIDQYPENRQDKGEPLEDALRYGRVKKYWMRIITGMFGHTQILCICSMATTL